jgi:hypothetical protein
MAKKWTRFIWLIYRKKYIISLLENPVLQSERLMGSPIKRFVMIQALLLCPRALLDGRTCRQQMHLIARPLPIGSGVLQVREYGHDPD